MYPINNNLELPEKNSIYHMFICIYSSLFRRSAKLFYQLGFYNNSYFINGVDPLSKPRGMLLLVWFFIFTCPVREALPIVTPI